MTKRNDTPTLDEIDAEAARRADAMREAMAQRHAIAWGDASMMEKLAQAVLDLRDGMGGDDQEESRAEDIATALRMLAAGRQPPLLLEHGAARALWFEEDESEYLLFR